PKRVLGDILAVRTSDGAAGERAVERPWIVHHLDLDEGRYVYLSPPPERGARPVAFSLVPLRPELRRRLELTSPGDAVAEEIVVELRGGASDPAAPDAAASFLADRTPVR
ncbi:MAG TPA: hypothetical protein VGS57_13485, partial [Thermoanaerobaculia bacterium]|nr:hypothetical protein [Thermoanaerobaculia bacterium]